MTDDCRYLRPHGSFYSVKSRPSSEYLLSTQLDHYTNAAPVEEEYLRLFMFVFCLLSF